MQLCVPSLAPQAWRAFGWRLSQTGLTTREPFPLPPQNQRDFRHFCHSYEQLVAPLWIYWSIFLAANTPSSIFKIKEHFLKCFLQTTGFRYFIPNTPFLWHRLNSITEITPTWSSAKSIILIDEPRKSTIWTQCFRPDPLSFNLVIFVANAPSPDSPSPK